MTIEILSHSTEHAKPVRNYFTLLSRSVLAHFDMLRSRTPIRDVALRRVLLRRDGGTKGHFSAWSEVMNSSDGDGRRRGRPPRPADDPAPPRTTRNAFLIKNNKPYMIVRAPTEGAEDAAFL
ncbi:hypothetical protein EVAR_95950_1 [Eumeta japonica]|uniref:Uncharacterized protein n=1 Tax=Eumeta variegata TaxID=151549 RepID=A0A4C1V8L4_EUMVA|nr:hypothetical protein EVAR_95950_1 [Eumeta japonica]